MADYDLYYWPVPFRGEFIRAILAYAGKSWAEHDAEAIGALMEADPAEQPVPFMGPPLLIEKSSGFALSQMPAIAVYLGTTLDLIPASAALRALTAKVVNDATDVIDEITLDGGREMWTSKSWDEFVPRLQRWMMFWEVMGTRHGLEAETGYLLGTDQPGVADIVTATLWSRMADRFPAIRAILEQTAPKTAGLMLRMQALPALAALNERSSAQYGEVYCGGDIETSLRAVLRRQT